MAFTTITLAPSLTTGARRRARRDGPRAVGSRVDVRRMLASAGFVDIDELDVTAQFIETTRAWIQERASHGAQLAPLEAPGAFEQRQRDHRAQLAAIEEGLLLRWIYSATRP